MEKETSSQRSEECNFVSEKGPLSAEDIENFKAWKQDLNRAYGAIMLNKRKHRATVNRFISMRLDKDVHATVTNLFPDDEEGLAALAPEILLQQIEERRMTTDQTKQKRLRFELAKQALEENLWSYEN